MSVSVKNKVYTHLNSLYSFANYFKHIYMKFEWVKCNLFFTWQPQNLHSCHKYQKDSVQLLSVLCVEWGALV